MGIKKDIYLAVKAQVLDQVKEIKTFELFNNQLQRESEEEARAYPLALFEYESILWESTAKQHQTGDADIVLHLAFERYQTEPLDYLDIVEKVYKALQGFAVDCQFSGLSRIEDEQDTDHDNCIVWKIKFKTQILDDAADPDKDRQQTTITGINITGDLDIDHPVIRTGDGNF